MIIYTGGYNTIKKSGLLNLKILSKLRMLSNIRPRPNFRFAFFKLTGVEKQLVLIKTGILSMIGKG